MIFVDTCILVAYYNDRDRDHERGVELIKKAVKGEYGKIYISDYVFDELLTVVFVRTKNHKKAVRVGEIILDSGIEILRVDEKAFLDAFELFKKLKMSFTDCTILSLSKSYGIDTIMTFDKAFEHINWIKTVN